MGREPARVAPPGARGLARPSHPLPRPFPASRDWDPRPASPLQGRAADATATYAHAYHQTTPTKRLCTCITLVGFVQCDQADPSKTRALGDFFETAMDKDGHLLISFVDAEGKSIFGRIDQRVRITG